MLNGGVIKKVFESQPAVSVHDRGGRGRGGGVEGQLSRAGKEVWRGGGARRRGRRRMREGGALGGGGGGGA